MCFECRFQLHQLTYNQEHMQYKHTPKKQNDISDVNIQ